MGEQTSKLKPIEILTKYLIFPMIVTIIGGIAVYYYTQRNTDINESLNMSEINIPDEAISFNGSYYKVFDTTLSWYAARNYAESLGGHLATITSREEQLFIESLIQDGDKDEYWLGGTNGGREGEWAWVTGERFTSETFQNWAPGEPNNQGGIEHYLIIINTWHPNLFGFWNDGTVEGSGNIGFIVEWNLSSQ